MSTPSRILVADEEKESGRTLGAVLEKDGYHVRLTPDGQEARHVLESGETDLVIADLVIPPLDGFELLRAAQQLQPAPPVILCSGYGTVEVAVKALKEGAYHYFQKPLDMDAVRAAVSEALSHAAVAAWYPATGVVPDSSGVHPGELGIVGRGPWFEQAMDLVRRVAPTRATVLLTGESGTGKELFARAIHRMGGRQGAFVAVSCAALSRDLLESELFGHEKGAFTGADRQRQGRFEMAHNGTLLLDEVGDIPLDLQVKLLRVLQEREFERVGGTETVTVDTRIVAATNRDLSAAVQERAFREDLYYRLKVVEIALPPLRERPHDIEPLARHFVRMYARANGKQVATLGGSVLRLLERYPWPGNARELENSIERAVVLAEPGETELDISLLPDAVRNGTPVLSRRPLLPMWLTEQPSASSAPLHKMDEQERMECLREALKKTGGNASRAARLLGVSARSVRYYVDKYGIWRRAHSRRSH